MAGAWEYDRGDAAGLRLAATIAMRRLIEPDLELTLGAFRGDRVTARITRGELTFPDPVLYVERLGLFEIARTEQLPDGSTVLELGAWSPR